MQLTFSYLGDFTIATDAGTGQTFRVLLATGTSKARFCLEPWNHGKAVFYRRRYIDADNPLFAAVEAAEKARPRTPLTPEQRRRIEADFA